MPLFIHLALVSALLFGRADPVERVRFATFNVKELTGPKLERVFKSGAGSDLQLRKAAEIIQRIRPDVLLINEIDFDDDKHQNAARFRDRYLKVSQNGQPPIDYEHIFFESVNTGVPTGKDLSNDGKANGPADAYGYGRYPGQYGMALLSRFPIDRKHARTFQKLLWKDVPGHLMPDGQGNRPAWYSHDEVAIFRLSSKSHWDVPVRINDTVVHLLCSHPTPPVFDGPEDRNGRRNFDEIRFWVDYLTGGDKPIGGDRAGYILDDQGRRGGLPGETHFVILGDLNADPIKDPRVYGRPAIELLLAHDRVQDPIPTSKGACAGKPAGSPLLLERRTADFGRIDYALPSKTLLVIESGVFWPEAGHALRQLVDPPQPSSDHRLVWVDVSIPSN